MALTLHKICISSNNIELLDELYYFCIMIFTRVTFRIYHVT